MSGRWIALAVGLIAAVGLAALAAVAAQSADEEAQAQGLGAVLRDFVAEVRVGMAEREQELRTTLGLDGTHDVVDAGL